MGLLLYWLVLPREYNLKRKWSDYFSALGCRLLLCWLDEIIIDKSQGIWSKSGIRFIVTEFKGKILDSIKAHLQPVKTFVLFRSILSDLLSSLPPGEPYCSVQSYIVRVTWDLHKYTLKVRNHPVPLWLSSAHSFSSFSPLFFIPRVIFTAGIKQ